MKQAIFVIAVFLLSFQANTSKLKVTEKTEIFNSGKHNALVVPVYEADQETIDKEWQAVLKKYNPKITGIGGEWLADNAVFKELSNNTVDISWKYEKAADNSIKLIAAYYLGGAFLTSTQHNKEFHFFEKMMNDFALMVTRKAINKQKIMAEKEIEKRNKKMTELQHSKETLQKDIELYKAKIAKAEQEIEKNKQQQETTKLDIEAQNKILKGIAEKERQYGMY